MMSLQPSGYSPNVHGELEPAGVRQHVGMNEKGEFRGRGNAQFQMACPRTANRVWPVRRNFKGLQTAAWEPILSAGRLVRIT